MNNTQLFDALSHIDETLVNRAAPVAKTAPVLRRGRLLRWGGAVAAALVAVTMVAVAVPMLTGDQGSPTGQEFPMEKIYSVAQTHLNGSSLISDEEADVSLKTVRGQDENHPKIDIYTILGTEYKLSYQQSTFSPRVSVSVHRFEMSDALRPYAGVSSLIDFYDDGSLAGIFCMELGFIDLNSSDKDEDVIAAAETIISQYTDISRYTNVERYRHTSETKGGFIFWYNEVGGKRLPGNTVMAISEDGMVWGIIIGFAYDFILTEDQLPTNEDITEIVMKQNEVQNLCNAETVRDFIIEYDIIIYQGEFYAHTKAGFFYTETLEDGTERKQYGSLEYLIPIIGSSVSYKYSEAPPATDE